jgi:O-antigen/teichoic acid export membrane protein
MYSLRLLNGVVFILLAYPLVARVLGPTNLGRVQFVTSIVAYFLLFINLGIPTYGRREIAFIRENKYKRSKFVLEMLIILLITTMITIMFYLIVINSFEFFNEYRLLFYVSLLNLVLAFFNFEWFYMGIEDQSYITIRDFATKTFSIVLIFIFIKIPEDYIMYAFIIAIGVGSSNLLNFIRIL